MLEPNSIDKVLDTQQKKLAFFQNLLLIAAADGRLDANESDFILLIGNKLGLSSKDVMPLADNLSLLSFIIPESGLQKTLELQTLVQLMVQDGQVHDKEYVLCLEYAHRIGYTKDILDNMIGQFSDDTSNQ
ncbi:TerB family tellurite resistance protein [Rhodocytophaga aerolata]|uniref:TerB family tellurite resistance protein n=1 Tax=Rhodocytophaga aerolata TaxID=455078 RepID=A0ABT8RAB5_9BACT|nr:TerB family tellurite resistance protein [Rhodocytophaga aerolata]MDO1448939.1 TerB family tellurite resistance protein [Rhodocytophaga aerolata]